MIFFCIYSFKINFLADSTLVIPEYKIELLSKLKKVINKFENIDKIENNLENKEKVKKSKSEKVVDFKKLKKTKIVKKKKAIPRTLWVRRKKRAVKLLF